MNSVSHNYLSTSNSHPYSVLTEEIKGSPLSVLIVDDEVDICFMLKSILRFKNIEAKYVTSLADAQIFLQNHDPQVIFLDNRLNDGFGINHIRSFKQQKPNTKIIMITAYDTPADRQKAFDEGVDFFIGKPFSRDIILNTIEKIN